MGNTSIRSWEDVDYKAAWERVHGLTSSDLIGKTIFPTLASLTRICHDLQLQISEQKLRINHLEQTKLKQPN